MLESMAFLISCEHGGYHLPAGWQDLFAGMEPLLRSHFGYDAGALSLATFLAHGLGAPLAKAEVTRLLVDLNRSPNSKSLFSAQSQALSEVEKEEILRDYYWPYRDQLKEKIIAAGSAGAQVVHLSVHSFTPIYKEQVRSADFGLLYDPSRLREKRFCQDWGALLQRHSPDLSVRYNFPYRGTADGLTRIFRDCFTPQDYLGIELEVNQALLAGGKTFPPVLQDCLLETLRELIPVD